MCFLTNSTQYQFLQYFLEFIRDSVKSSTIYMPDYMSASNRHETMMSVRLYDDRGKVSKTKSRKATCMLNIKPDVPTITCGGPRFIHTAREWALVQYELLKEISATSYPELFRKTPDQQDLLYVRFGRKNIQECDNTLPVPTRCMDRLLIPHPDFLDTLLNFSDDIYKEKKLLDAAEKANRPQRELIVEWMRIHPEEIHRFLDACRKERKFARTYRKVYEPLRMISLRLMNEDVVPVKLLDKAIERDLDETNQWLTTKIQSLRDEMQFMKDMKDKLEKERAKTKDFDRTETRNLIKRFMFRERAPDRSGLTPVMAFQERRRLQGQQGTTPDIRARFPSKSRSRSRTPLPRKRRRSKTPIPSTSSSADLREKIKRRRRAPSGERKGRSPTSRAKEQSPVKVLRKVSDDQQPGSPEIIYMSDTDTEKGRNTPEKKKKKGKTIPKYRNPENILPDGYSSFSLSSSSSSSSSSNSNSSSSESD